MDNFKNRFFLFINGLPLSSLMSTVIIFSLIYRAPMLIVDKEVSYDPFDERFCPMGRRFADYPFFAGCLMPPIDAITTRIVLETDCYRVEGDITLPPLQDINQGLSKFINSGDLDFLHLVNVEMVPLDGSGSMVNYSSINLAKKNIRLIVPKMLPN